MVYRRTSSSSSALQPSDGARRYFRQFLGETVSLSEAEASFLPLLEGMDKDALVDLGERAYEALRQSPSAGTAHPAPLFSDKPPLAPSELRTAAYVALVNAVARELDIPSPAEAREERGLSLDSSLPALPHDHLVLVARFSLDALQSARLPTSFGGVVDLVVDRLSALVEIASQAMMGADVDPYETFEYADCEACGHLLQCHVGFETWEEVRAEHRLWCPGARGR